MRHTSEVRPQEVLTGVTSVEFIGDTLIIPLSRPMGSGGRQPHLKRYEPLLFRQFRSGQSLLR